MLQLLSWSLGWNTQNFMAIAQPQKDGLEHSNGNPRQAQWICHPFTLRLYAWNVETAANKQTNASKATHENITSLIHIDCLRKKLLWVSLSMALDFGNRQSLHEKLSKEAAFLLWQQRFSSKQLWLWQVRMTSFQKDSVMSMITDLLSHQPILTD